MLLLPLLLELIKSRVSSQATKALQDLAKVTRVQIPLTTLLPTCLGSKGMPDLGDVDPLFVCQRHTHVLVS